MSEPKSERKKVRSHFYAIISKMPPLAHWPNRDVPFDYENSEVVKWMMDHPEFKHWLFEKARSSEKIIFDKNSKLWMGRDYIPPDGSTPSPV